MWQPQTENGKGQQETHNTVGKVPNIEGLPAPQGTLQLTLSTLLCRPLTCPPRASPLHPQASYPARGQHHQENSKEAGEGAVVTGDSRGTAEVLRAAHRAAARPSGLTAGTDPGGSKTGTQIKLSPRLSQQPHSQQPGGGTRSPSADERSLRSAEQY